MSRKRIFVMSVLFLGTALLLGSIWSLFSLKSTLDQGTLNAKALDSVYGAGGGLPPDPCRQNPPVLSIEVMPTHRVMSESDTQALTVSLTNHDKTLTCNEGVSLDAPEFDFSPTTPSERSMTVPAGQKRSLTWIVAPRRPGTFELMVGIEPFSVYPTVGITVTNIFGLTIWQAQLLSYGGTFLGTFFGPILSFTWWYQLWKKHRRKKAPPPSSSTQPPTGPVGKLLAKKPGVSDH